MNNALPTIHLTAIDAFVLAAADTQSLYVPESILSEWRRRMAKGWDGEPPQEPTLIEIAASITKLKAGKLMHEAAMMRASGGGLTTAGKQALTEYYGFLGDVLFQITSSK